MLGLRVRRVRVQVSAGGARSIIRGGTECSVAFPLRYALLQRSSKAEKSRQGTVAAGKIS